MTYKVIFHFKVCNAMQHGGGNILTSFARWGTVLLSSCPFISLALLVLQTQSIDNPVIIRQQHSSKDNWDF